MNANLSVACALGLTVLLQGCEKHPVATAPPSPPSGMTQPAQAMRDPIKTVDPSLPSLDASAQTPKSATDSKAESTLTRTESDTKMPMAGQVNDHSSPAIAKKGDSAVPATTTK